ncbi:uncharacterized protein UTRI_00342 [Ustilago trichophora]|uniref:CTLH domain-containing protein n=1 Tax=Ustilago trichophora TaxID=86804 RepID=A0A5C3DR97_9BASI|nr:uncharacterized protein UTRI_00342 [Ustilago trichophora]
MQSSKNDRGNTSQPSSDDADLTSPANLRKLVLNYLLHHCYTDTAIAFAKDGIIGDLYGTEPSALPSSSDAASLTLNNAGGATSSATASCSRSAPSPSAAAASSTDSVMRSSNGGGRQAHPLSAPPLSRDDSSMEIEVENLLPTSSEQPDASTAESNGHSNGASHRSLRSRSGAVGYEEEQDDEDLEDAELASEYDEVEEDLDVDISPDLTAEDVKGVLARKQIREYIISGHIRQAMDLINEHFPTVLTNSSNGSSPNGTKSSRAKATSSSSSTSAEKILPANPTSMEPDHLLLNLQIQVFIEAIRSASSAQLAPPSSASLSAGGALPSLASTTPGIAASISRAASPAPSTSSSNGSATSATGTNAALNPALHSALSYAQGLYASAQKLPSFWRAMYLKELEQVTALLAYTDVERSPVRRFLTRSRKVALAEQVNSAILSRSGKPSQPLIEVAVRQTTLMCYHAATDEISVPVGHPMWGLVGGGAGAGGYDEAANGGKKSREGRKVPLWKFRNFLQER